MRADDPGRLAVRRLVAAIVAEPSPTPPGTRMPVRPTIHGTVTSHAVMTRDGRVLVRPPLYGPRLITTSEPPTASAAAPRRPRPMPSGAHRGDRADQPSRPDKSAAASRSAFFAPSPTIAGHRSSRATRPSPAQRRVGPSSGPGSQPNLPIAPASAGGGFTRTSAAWWTTPPRTDRRVVGAP